MIKKIVTFLVCLIPWFLTSILKIDYTYLDTLKTPFFTPPKGFYPIAWSTIYILIAITIYNVISSYKLKNIPKNYTITLIINYILNQSFTIFFFGLKSTVLGMIAALGTFLSSLFLYEETSLIHNKISKLLYPYILLSLFATILSISIYLLNL